MDIIIAKECDIDCWIRLVSKVKDNFPGLETKEALAEHRDTVLDFIHKKSAICARIEDKIVGALLFSKDNNMLCFLAVDPTYRRQHIAEQMFRFMLPLMTPGTEITVTTYREGVPEGVAARAFYQKLGFVPGRMTVEFGSKVQEFVMEVAKWQIS
ncbi:MAG: GNAT family N-acetyltransferase [Bacillus sp. (in: firmicutes)]